MILTLLGWIYYKWRYVTPYLKGNSMSFINNNMKWIMLISGLITFTMISAVFLPHLALFSMFGSSLEGPLAEVVVRNWGALIALIGGMLIYGAFHAEVRQLVLVVAVMSKLTFIALVVLYGFSDLLILAISIDAFMVALFILSLLSKKEREWI